ncbi:hypothetical protein PROSTU_00830 [Providencia stuartii ATCC 25827]|uniref:Uncharacterized protein n=1 Tax=Providencia stuartii ATCC 25827 TaxID=471874 RepID=A0AA87CVY7_PROST|nr:hypothetical protein PROSTU_00830 [Providencia stuartii ATCC 25827]
MLNDLFNLSTSMMRIMVLCVIQRFVYFIAENKFIKVWISVDN